ncbi:MAG: translesion error-prone DNA polymerase V autoproteolytic subunit [Betaproteobacteria bacterium]|nr:translesion error-prone DNA polymerase V autoproteolytic subunit [Betaproteobacteria bacterium]MDE2212768.1 translesion error-prone DNA polymerase V autoproteolytic subunit [Betaproteobacteria bacterium]
MTSASPTELPDLDPVSQPLAAGTGRQPLRLLGHFLSAGFPSPAEPYEEEALDLTEYLVRNRAATFLFTVKGDSMKGAGIVAGDKVLVDRALEACHGDIVVAAVAGEYTLKRLFRREGEVALLPENPAYAPIRFREGAELQVWGVVVGLVRRYRRR